MTSKTKILTLSAFLAFFACDSLLAEQTRNGESEFKSYCASCHGLDGKGNGPFVKFLKDKPKSLTTLARDNQGVFPFSKVYDVIDGRKHMSEHGTKDMPIWGERYAIEILNKYGEYSTTHPETVRCRILELVFYLAELQEYPDTVLER